MPGTIVPRASGGVVVALPDQFAALDLDTGALTKLADVEVDNPANRCNDGKCDPQGRLWTGTMPISEDSTSGTMYRLDPDHSVRPMFDGVTISNGLCWSPDQSTMYYIDTPDLSISMPSTSTPVAAASAIAALSSRSPKKAPGPTA